MKRTLMICFVFPPRFSGAAFQAIGLVEALSKYGIKCDFFVPNYQDDSVYRKSNEHECNVHRVKRGIFFPLGLLFFLIFNRKKYFVVHFHGISNIHFFCVFIAKLFGLKIVQKLTTGNEKNNELNRGGRLKFFRKIAYKSIDKYVPISSVLERALINYGIPRHKIHFIPNGVDISFFKPLCHTDDKNKLKYRFGLDAHDNVMIFVGTVRAVKNLLVLLEIFNLTLIKLPAELRKKTKLIIAGPVTDAAYFEQLKSFVASKKIDQQVMFLGSVDKQVVTQLCSLSEIMVFTGMLEGCPNILIEAKSSGIPVIAFKAGGVEDIIVHGIDGYMVEPDDLSCFVDYLVLLLEDKKLRKRFSLAARQNCVERYSFENIALQYKKTVYDFTK